MENINSELRNLRDVMMTVEDTLQEIANKYGISFKEAINEFNEIYHEFTSPYHNEPQLYVTL